MSARPHFSAANHQTVMTIDWNEYLSEEGKLRQPSVMKSEPRTKDTISFASGLPNNECFPLKGLQIRYETPESGFAKTALESTDAMEDQAKAKSEVYEACQYMSGRGTSYFDEWTRQHVARSHHPKYSEWDCLIQCGGTYSLPAILTMLCDPGVDSVMCEELSYPCFMETCVPMRLKVVPVKLDSEGVVPEDVDRILSNWDVAKQGKKPKLFYAMPVGQNPSGITMSLARRQGLFDVCQKHDLIILEDDPYFHLQLSKQKEKLLSLLDFDTDGRVLRIESFSKMLMPGMRVSIVTGNKTFINVLTMSNELSIHSAAAPSQLIIYMLMQKWGQDGLDKWLVHLQGLYRTRRDIMLEAFDKELPADLCSWNRPEYGMFIWLKITLSKFPKLDKSLTDAEWALKVEDVVFEKALDDEIQLAKGHWFMVDQNLVMAGFRTTYAFASFDDIKRGAERLGRSIRDAYKELYG